MYDYTYFFVDGNLPVACRIFPTYKRGMSGVIERGFRKRIDDFLSASGMAPSALGSQAVNDRNIIIDFRKGKRRISIQTADKILAFIKEQTEGAANGSDRAQQ